MRERGYVVARGDRRGFVGVDVHGEVYSIPRYSGVQTKAVRQRLRDEGDLPGVDQAKAQIASDMLPVIDRLKDELDVQAQAQDAEFGKRRRALVERQRAERRNLNELHKNGRIEGNRMRQARFRKGLKGLWDRLRGEHRRLRQQNEREAQKAQAKDRTEKDQLAFRHLDQRRQIEIFRLRIRRQRVKDSRILEQDRQTYRAMRTGREPEP